MSLFRTKRYLFHVHTTLTDGKITVAKYLQTARKLSLEVGFLEHIRKNPTYDPIKFMTDIRDQAEKEQIKVKVGFEVNVAENGLNIPSKAVQEADMLGLAVHRYKGTPIELLTAYVANIKRIRAIKKDIPIIWVHPGLWFRRNGLLKENTIYFFTLLKYVIRRGLLVEINTRHDLPPLIFRGFIPRKQRIVGGDIHTPEDLQNYLTRVK